MRLLELARDAQRLFAQQGPEEKRKLLKFVVSNSTWQHGVLTGPLRQPFDLLAETAMTAARLAGPDGAIPPGHSVWLGFLDTYRTRCLAPPTEFRHVLDEAGRLGTVR